MKVSRTNHGEIVPVDGGLIIRSTGKKDRHSKVFTAKGPRDRRVRLSAHTAIQFYDVQDRLGYDRPSKAVDWLISKAKAAIDSLDELPPPQWRPAPDSKPNPSEYNFHNSNNDNNSAFLEAAAGEGDPIKSFCPSTSFAGFHNDPCQDLGLSLQTFQGDGRGSPDFPFQGSFERIEGWNGAGAGAGAVFLQGLSFAQRELVLHSNAANYNQWNTGRDRTSFELGFRVPARIYGEEEEAAENRR